LIGQAWIAVQNRPDQDSGSDSHVMQKIKNFVKLFVKKLENNIDGIEDENEFKSIIYFILNFIDPKVSTRVYPYSSRVGVTLNLKVSTVT